MPELYPPLWPYETEILLWINSHHTPILDAFMYLISHEAAWFPILVVLLYYLFSQKPWQEGLLLLIAVVVSLVVCNLLANVLSKPFFARPRPTHTAELQGVLHIVYGYVGRMYGFFSGHTSNFFAAATVLALAVRQRWHSLLLYFIVGCVIYSRLYLGMHYLSDVLVGLGVGAVVGYLAHRLHEALRRRYAPLRHEPTSQVFAANLRIWMATLLLFLPLVWAFAWQVVQILNQAPVSL